MTDDLAGLSTPAARGVSTEDFIDAVAAAVAGPPQFPARSLDPWAGPGHPENTRGWTAGFSGCPGWTRSPAELTALNYRLGRPGMPAASAMAR